MSVQRCLRKFNNFQNELAFVNPQMLQTGMPVQGVFLATIICPVVELDRWLFYANPCYTHKLQAWGLMLYIYGCILNGLY